jgi:transposase InsO family protein
LAVILDLRTRLVVGWALADHMRTELIDDALSNALVWRAPEDQMIHHSDRGSQYASRAYRGRLEAAGIRVSMSRRANCWDNAVLESFFGTTRWCISRSVVSSGADRAARRSAGPCDSCRTPQSAAAGPESVRSSKANAEQHLRDLEAFLDRGAEELEALREFARAADRVHLGNCRAWALRLQAGQVVNARDLTALFAKALDAIVREAERAGQPELGARLQNTLARDLLPDD